MSGDLGRPGLPIIRDPETPPRPIDLLVMESTYGNRVHAPIAGMHDDLARVIGATIERGGKVVIPAFAVGRTQELLVALGELFRTGALPRIPVYIDSPLAIDVTTVFQLHPECFDAPTRRRLDEDGELFRFAGLHVTRTREESMAINAQGGPAVILAGSGMAEGGRILAELHSAPLNDLLRDMLKYSNNLTAEMVGLAATTKRTGNVPGSLKASARPSRRAVMRPSSA